jgi:APA family basic amino acid/polyamine antiporter
MAPATPPGLQRRLGTADAVYLGLGSMIGAGVFAVWAPAAQAAGGALLAALVVAGLVAYCNATSSAQLAVQYPTSGGTYLYGRERLGDWWGFLAGWGFVIGKTASCAAMALTFAAYAVPAPWQRPAAALAVVVVAAVNYHGITRTAGLTRVIVVAVLAGLALAVAAAGTGGLPQLDALVTGDGPSLYGVLQAAGLLFFAFAGYARIATLAEEVRDPGRTIPRAVNVALLLTVAIYATVGVAVLATLGAGATAASSSPVAAAVASGPWSWAAPLVRATAALASLGALLALVAGVGRTALSMGRNGDLPGWLAAVHPRHHVPHHAEVALAAAVSALVLLVDLRGAIGFSSFGVLLYYLVANASAATQTGEHRRFPRTLQGVGALGCVTLMATLPIGSVLSGVAMLLVGVGYRLHRLRRVG